ncbi:MAG: hypothetical protein M0D55_16070 [Elusimicrobiota bacterium]|nr:MAG: hypothetical protein M0D55_16070 [Elusimicrobiota bacterium]
MVRTMTSTTFPNRPTSTVGAIALLACAILLPSTALAKVAHNADPFEIPAATQDEVLFFNSSNGFVIQISSNGRTMAAIRRRDRPEYSQIFQLRISEMKELLTLIKSVESAPFNPNTPPVMDCPDERLRIAINRERRVTSIYCRSEFQPLTSFLYKIFNQTEHLWRIEHKREIYEVASALSPTSAGFRVLQPAVLLDPLKTLVSSTSDFSNLQYAMDALSHLMRPNEWSDFLSTELDASSEAKRVRLLYVVSSVHFRIEGGYMEARAPVFLKQLQKEYLNWPTFTHEKVDAYGAMVSVLCQQHYAPAVPTLIQALADMKDYNAPPGAWGYAHMQEPIISPLEDLLTHAKPQTRTMAAYLLGRIVGINPMLVKIEDQERMLKQLRAGPISKLKKLAKTDSVPQVREVAQRAAEDIERGWVR